MTRPTHEGRGQQPPTTPPRHIRSSIAFCNLLSLLLRCALTPIVYTAVPRLCTRCKKTKCCGAQPPVQPQPRSPVTTRTPLPFASLPPRRASLSAQGLGPEGN